MSHLEEFLSQEAQQGTHSGSGSWTMDLRAACTKLSQHLFPSPQQLLLKVIQAMVAAGSSHIHLESDGRFLSVSGTNCRLSQHIADSPHWRVALGVAWGAGLDPGLAYFREGLMRTLLPSARSPKLKMRDGLVFWVNASWSKSLAPLLATRCEYCPVPISWNQRQLPSLTASLYEDTPGHWPPGLRLVELLADHPSQALQVAGLPKTQAWNSDLEKVLFRADVRAPQSQLRQGAVIPEKLHGTSWLVFVQDGVTLEPIELLQAFGCLVVLDGSGLPVDVSTLRVREGAELDEARRHALTLLQQAADTAVDSIHCLKKNGLLANSPGRLAWKAVVLLTLGLAYFFVPEPWFNKILLGVPSQFHSDKWALLERLGQLRADLTLLRGS